MGGVSADHIGPRHLLSHASALQRQDNACWGDVAAGVTGGKLAAIATGKPFLCPARVLQSDARLGAALLDGHEIRLAATNPGAQIVAYPGCGHNVHRARAFEDRFMRELEDFVATTA